MIDQPGDYITRNGSRVTIHAIHGPSHWPAKGSVWKMFRGRIRPRGYAIWTTSGQFRALGQHPLDIVARYEDAAA